MPPKKKFPKKYHIDNPTKDDCLWCSKTVVKPVRCITCNQAFHSRCAEQCGYLASGAVRKCCDSSFNTSSPPLGDVTDSGETDCDSLSSCNESVTKQFLCDSLHNLVNEITASITENSAALEARINAHLNSIQSIVNEVSTVAYGNKAAIEDLKATYSKHSNQIATLSTINDTCTNSIQTLRQELDDLKTSSANTIAEAVQAAFHAANVNNREELIGEFFDRLRRSNKLIFFKIPENNNGKGNQADLTTIVDLLKLTIKVDENSISVRRLGQYKNGGCRPILVCLNSSDDVKAILSKKSTTYKNYSFTSDKTQTQRDYLSSLWSQVDEFNKKGPQVKKTVRYINNVPCIIDTSKNSNNPKNA